MLRIRLFLILSRGFRTESRFSMLTLTSVRLVYFALGDRHLASLNTHMPSICSPGAKVLGKGPVCAWTPSPIVKAQRRKSIRNLDWIEKLGLAPFLNTFAFGE